MTSPPLHTFLITQLLNHTSGSVLGPRLLTVGFAAILLASLFLLVLQVSGLATAAITTALVMASPGFIELSSSCMLEIPALATGVSALCLLLAAPDSKYRLREVVAGAIFGAALQIKLAPALLLPLAAFLIALNCLKQPVPVRSVLISVFVFGASLSVAWAATDFLTDRWAYALYFKQAWASHFAAPKSFDYGSARDHSFAWSLLLKNWDGTVPACVGMIVLVCLLRKVPQAAIPLAWLTLSLGFFATHRPWWAYYYIHIAIPLCWCAALAIEGAWVRVRSRHVTTVLVLGAYVLCALPWMAGRLYYQISDIRNSPQTYSSLVLTEIKRFKPHTQWIYADDLVYSLTGGALLLPAVAGKGIEA